VATGLLDAEAFLRTHPIGSRLLRGRRPGVGSVLRLRAVPRPGQNV